MDVEDMVLLDVDQPGRMWNLLGETSSLAHSPARRRGAGESLGEKLMKTDPGIPL